MDRGKNKRTVTLRFISKLLSRVIDVKYACFTFCLYMSRLEGEVGALLNLHRRPEIWRGVPQEAVMAALPVIFLLILMIDTVYFELLTILNQPALQYRLQLTLEMILERSNLLIHQAW